MSSIASAIFVKLLATNATDTGNLKLKEKKFFYLSSSEEEPCRFWLHVYYV